MRVESNLKLFPTPFRSVLLFVVWLLLNNSISVGHIILGAFLATVIPLIILPF